MATLLIVRQSFGALIVCIRREALRDKLVGSGKGISGVVAGGAETRRVMSDLKQPDDRPNLLNVTTTHTMQSCPVCFGRGFVMSGFYSACNTTQTWSGSNLGTEMCRSCGGRGIV